MRIATDRIVSTAIAMMPGAVLARLRSAKHRAGWLGSWSAWRRERLIRCFLAWVALVMEEEISGWLLRPCPTLGPIRLLRSHRSTIA